MTDRIVEPRLRRSPTSNEEHEEASALATMKLADQEKRALGFAVLSNIAVLAVFFVLVVVPGMPLHGPGQPTLPDGKALVHQPITISPQGAQVNSAPEDILAREPIVVSEAEGRAPFVEPPGSRWSHVVVPLIFFAFLFPGLIYGRMTGKLKSQRDFVEAVHSGMRNIVPVLVIMFFMAQFVNYFAYTMLDRMLAYAGGSLLVQASLPPEALIPPFVLIVIFGDFAISGMLSKLAYSLQYLFLCL